jgi:hypothetical protein
VAVLAIALIAVARPSHAPAPVGAKPGESLGPSVSGSQPPPPQQAAHIGTMAAGGFVVRLADSGQLPASGPAAIPPLRVGGPATSPDTRAAAPGPPHRVRLCTWLL